MSCFQYFNEIGYGTTIAPLFHYSQAVTIGNIIKLSGQGGWNAEGKFEGDDLVLSKQVANAFANVEKVLHAAGSKGWEDVYSVRSYHTDLNSTIGLMVENFKVWMPMHKPIWTAVEVVRLAFLGQVLEIEVEANRV